MTLFSHFGYFAFESVDKITRVTILNSLFIWSSVYCLVLLSCNFFILDITIIFSKTARTNFVKFYCALAFDYGRLVRTLVSSRDGLLFYIRSYADLCIIPFKLIIISTHY